MESPHCAPGVAIGSICREFSIFIGPPVCRGTFVSEFERATSDDRGLMAMTAGIVDKNKQARPKNRPGGPRRARVKPPRILPTECRGGNSGLAPRFCVRGCVSLRLRWGGFGDTSRYEALSHSASGCGTPICGRRGNLRKPGETGLRALRRAHGAVSASLHSVFVNR